MADLLRLQKGPVSGFVSRYSSVNVRKNLNEAVLVSSFFLEFVSPKKRIMSEGCWLFTLKMTMHAYKKKDFSHR